MSGPLIADLGPSLSKKPRRGSSIGDIEFERCDDVNPFCTRLVKPGAIAFIDPEGNKIVDDDSLWSSHLNLIVGPHGCGKTTLLKSVIDRQQVTWIRLRGAKDGVTATRQILRSKRRLVVDGYECCDPILRTLWMVWCVCTGRKMLATSHRPIFGHRVVRRCDWDRRLAKRLVMDQIADSMLSARDDEIHDAVVRHLDESLDNRRGENYRDLFFELYDVVQPMLGRRRELN